jgi:hypothetical protein
MIQLRVKNSLSKADLKSIRERESRSFCQRKVPNRKVYQEPIPKGVCPLLDMQLLTHFPMMVDREI